MNHFNIRLQPIVSLKSRQIYGYEVLSEVPGESNAAKRFEHCDPAQLLQLRARQLDTLSSQGINTKLFVNLTTGILVNNEAVKTLLLEPSPGVIELQDPQVLPGLMLRTLRQLVLNIRHLQQAGYEIWLDDYDSGYHDTLEQTGLQFDGVKLDYAAFQKYRNDIDGTASLIGEARRFGSLVLAEGIENLDDFRTAGLAGADLAQGFYWPEYRIISTSAHRHTGICPDDQQPFEIKLDPASPV